MPVQVLNFFKGLFPQGRFGHVAHLPQQRSRHPKSPWAEAPRFDQTRLACAALLQCSSVFRWARRWQYKGKFFDHLGTAFIVFIQAVPAAVYICSFSFTARSCWALA